MAKLLEITGKAISGEWGQDDDTGTGIPVLRTTNFTNEGFVNYKNVVTRSISKKNIAEKYLRHGDVIIEKSGGSDKQPVGRVIFFEGEENKYLFNNFTGLLRVQNPEEWLPKYVFYALYAYYRNGGTRAFENRTTGLHNLQVDNYVKSVDIPKLSYREQQHICETLDHVRDAVAYREQQLSKLDELIKARFVEMFGNAETTSQAQTKRLEECCISISGGNTPSMQHPEYYGGKIPFIKSGDVKSDHISVSSLTLTQIALNETTVKMLPKGTLIVVIRSAALLKEFRIGILDVDAVINQDLKALQTSDDVLPVYLMWAIKMKSQVLLSRVQTMLTSHIRMDDLLDLKVQIPPLSLQNQFADFVAEVDKSKVEVQKSLDQTQLLFDSLMQQYFG